MKPFCRQSILLTEADPVSGSDKKTVKFDQRLVLQMDFYRQNLVGQFNPDCYFAVFLYIHKSFFR